MFKGAILVSGIFDLEPLLSTSNNDQLHLDQAEAFSQSPINHAAGTNAPQLIAYGEDETEEFKWQSNRYAAARGSSNARITRHVIPGHHFDVLNELSDERCGFHRSALQFIAALSSV
jgi:arylformamidase